MLQALQYNLQQTWTAPASPRGRPSSSSVPQSPRSRAGGPDGSGGITPRGRRGADPATDAASASTSPVDKAAQHAVKAAEYYLLAAAAAAAASPSAPGNGNGSPCEAPHPSDAGADQQRDPSPAAMWLAASEVLLPEAADHHSYMVRSAAIGVLGSVPDTVLLQLPPRVQQRIVDVLTAAAAREAVAAVRSAACRAVGVLCTLDSTPRTPSRLEPFIAAMAAAARDAAVSVRITASWAAANLCDNCRLFSAAAPDRQLLGLAPLAEASVSAAQDVDKVRANGIRAVGNLLAFVADARQFDALPAAFAGRPPASAAASQAFESWLPSALQSVQSCLTTGSMKVQWNACCAVSGLFKNATLLQHSQVQARLTTYLTMLVLLVRDSGNYKIRTHAASALGCLSDRSAFSTAFADALLVSTSALEALDGGGVGGGVSSSGGVGERPRRINAAAVGGDTDLEGADDGKFPNFRFVAGLCQQLRATVLHLLALAAPEDAPAVRELLTRRLDFLTQVGFSACLARLADACR